MAHVFFLYAMTGNVWAAIWFWLVRDEPKFTIIAAGNSCLSRGVERPAPDFGIFHPLSVACSLGIRSDEPI